MRLIDADDLWSDIMMLPHNGDMISSEEVEQAIKDAPTIDPASREMLEKAEEDAAVYEYVKAATWIVCPMCDEPKCVGRFNCPEIKAWIEEKKRREENHLTFSSMEDVIDDV